MTPLKPIINLEARYDSEFNQKQLRRLPRSCGYLTILSGAAGYTYGCAGIWNWGQSFVGKDPQASPWSWHTGWRQPSAGEMMHMAEFFGGIEWWRLEPCHDLIRNQADDWTQHMVMAKTAEGDLAVAYLPDNPAITIDMRPFPTAMRSRWHDPQTGKQVPLEQATPNTDEAIFTRPAQWQDALLVLHTTGRTRTMSPAQTGP